MTYDVRANLLAEDGVRDHHIGEIEMLAENGIRGCKRPIAWWTKVNGRKRNEKLSHVAKPQINELGASRSYAKGSLAGLPEPPAKSVIVSFYTPSP